VSVLEERIKTQLLEERTSVLPSTNAVLLRR